MADEFATNGSTYARDHFYVTATDSKGHSSKIRVSTPPEVKGQIAALIASKALPMYRTEEDFHRDALVHRLHDLGELTSNGFTLPPELEAMRQQLEAEAELEQYRRSIDADQRIYNEAEHLLQMRHDYPEVDAVIQAAARRIKNDDLRSRLLRSL